MEVASNSRPVKNETAKYGEQWRLSRMVIESMRPKEGVEIAFTDERGTPDFFWLSTRKNSSPYSEEN